MEQVDAALIFKACGIGIIQTGQLAQRRLYGGFHQPSVNLLANIAGYVLVGAYSAGDSVKISGFCSEMLDDATDVINLPEMFCSQRILRSRCRKETWV